MKRNFLLLTDSYKAGLSDIYPEDVEYIYAYVGNRRNRITFFGLQYFMKEYLEGVAFTLEDVQEAETFYNTHSTTRTFNANLWRKLYDKHGGRLPIVIHALKEGTRTKMAGPFMSVENTDPEFPWIVPFLESFFVRLWAPVAAATSLGDLKSNVDELFRTNSDIAGTYSVHDSSYRGQGSDEDAALFGAAHLLYFATSDNIPAIRLLEKHYYADLGDTTIPTMDHTLPLCYQTDKDAVTAMLDKYPSGPVSLITDTYDQFTMINTVIGNIFSERIKQRDGVVFVRPDSGNSRETLVWALKALGSAFGYEKNTKGMKVVDEKVRVMYTDGTNESILNPFYEVTYDGFAPENIVMGYDSLTNMHINTNQVYYSISSIRTAKDTVDVNKRARGKVTLMGRVAMGDDGPCLDTQDGNLFEKVFENGEILRTHTFQEICTR